MSEYTGKDIRKLRERSKMSQEEFARVLGISAFTVSRWERTTDPISLRPRSARVLQAIEENAPPGDATPS
jgi:DNA-binding transcriptional regulator YiaG